MKSVIFQIILVILVSDTMTSASILDLFNWNPYDDAAEKRDETRQTDCACDGPSCMCCVDFNLTYIDLGGPGCVQMKYLSQMDGVSVNVSYGDSLLHSDQVKGPKPEPTCMGLLGNLAQVCAHFDDLLPYKEGLRGCLALEPKLLGDVTATFNIGCFTMGPDEMKLEESANSTFTPFLPNETENVNANGTENEAGGLNEEELIAAVNESAEQGLAFFGNLLGLTFTKPETNDSNSESVTPSTYTSNETSSTNQQISRKSKHIQTESKYNHV